jgi:signal transduction histidine kinase
MVVRAQRLATGPRALVDRPRLRALPTPSPTVSELRRLERDLHDGVQNELVALIVKLSLLSQDPATPLRAQAACAPVDVTVRGSAPRSTHEAEAAAYFSCLEAVRNAIKHAGRGASVTVALRYEHSKLTVRIEDDGRGSDPERTPRGSGLWNICHRAEAVGRSITVTSSWGRGTALTISLPWPAE